MRLTSCREFLASLQVSVSGRSCKFPCLAAAGSATQRQSAAKGPRVLQALRGGGMAGSMRCDAATGDAAAVSPVPGSGTPVAWPKVWEGGAGG